MHFYVFILGYYDHVIELAKTAIAICDENDQNRVSFIMGSFNNHVDKIRWVVS